ncbi:MAG: hypothetical protein QXU82_01615 [Candidatus Aenigmatarchaeota archaeon]
MQKPAYSQSIVEQARFIDDFSTFMNSVGDCWIGGGWCASLITERLQREHGGVDLCAESSNREDILDYLLDNGFSIRAQTKNKLIANKDDLRAYIVLMDYANGCFMFSTEKFYKNIRVPKEFFRRHEGSIEDLGLAAITLTPALFVSSKKAYGSHMRDKDLSDIRAVEAKLAEEGMEKERELYEKESRELLAYR